MKKIWFQRVLVLLLLLSLSLCAGAEVLKRGEYKSREVLSVYVEDIDDDDSKEVIALTKEGIVVLNSTAGILWKFGLDRTRTVYIDDVNKDGKREVIVSAGDSINNLERGSLYILNEKGEPFFNFEYMTGTSYPKYIYYSFVTADIANDGYKELLGGGVNGIYTLRDTYDKVVWSYRTNETVLGMSLVDSNNVWAEKEVLAHSYMQLFVFSLNGSLLNNASVPGGISKVYTVDLRNNSGEEVFVLTDEGTLYLFDESLRLLARTSPVNNPREAAFFDIGGNGTTQVVLGSGNGVYILDYRLMVSNRFITNETVHGLFFLDWDNDNEKEIICGSGRYVYSLDKGAQLKERYELGQGIRDVVVSDLDSNGMIDAVVLEDDGIYFFENNESGMGKRARAYYTGALASVELRRYADAERSLEAARSIYTDLGDSAGVKQCDELVRRIWNNILNEKRASAEELLAKADEEFALENYDSALGYLNQSKEIFSGLNDSESVERCDSLYNRIVEDQKKSKDLLNPKIDVDVSTPRDVNILPVLSFLLIIIILVMVFGLMKKK